MQTDLFGLSGKHIIVIGGGQGIGEATCDLLADVGAGVAVLDASAERAERVAAKVAARGVGALPVVCDVLDDEALVTAIDTAERELGPLDGMVTVVGMGYMSASLNLPMDVWDTEHRRNLRYVFVAARALARRLVGRGAPGSIVSVSSVSGIRAATNHAAYGAAKAGLNNMAMSLAAEWAQYGIRYNVVASGGIITPRVPYKSDADEQAMIGGVPMARRGHVVEIAKTLAFFLSDMSSYVTGQTLAVDGGYSAVGPLNYDRFADMNVVPGIEVL